MLCILSSKLLAQNVFLFLVEVPNSTYVPPVTYDYNGNRIAYSLTGNSALDILIDSYEIYSSEHVFKDSPKATLQNIYFIKCNDMELMDKLHANFNAFYPRVQDINGGTLTMPDDFGNTGGYTGLGSEQEELNYIRAPETWDILTKGDKNVIIGIADTNFRINHEDIDDTLEVIYGVATTSGDQHGTEVSGAAAGETNNGVGLASIGYDSYIKAARGTNVVAYDTVSQATGVKVVNASWFEARSSNGGPIQITPDRYDDIHNRGVVMVAAAGNAGFNNNDATEYYYPASYKNVISVSSIGHHNHTFLSYSGTRTYQTFLDSHEYLIDSVVYTHQHNDSIDIVAPGIDITYVNGNGIDWYGYGSFGTSFSAPFVSGTIALMFDLNYCLDTKEVETILKLTAVKIDTLPQNLAYHGKLGAGKLDAYEAVKMAKDMAEPFGTVEVKNRILYRPWFYKLDTAPYEIKMTNNDVSAGSKLKFRARNNIEILSGEYAPGTGGYIDLAIDTTLVLNDCPARPTAPQARSVVPDKGKIGGIGLINISPTLVQKETVIRDMLNREERIHAIKVYNIFGRVVYEERELKTNRVNLNINKLSRGIYIIKVFDDSGGVLHTEKIVKE
ncbi:MAG: S8 family serine peptidase [Bacteroidota bacterium]